jgi:pimeloyl-ACP methyl ester carboxylesterase
VARIDGVRAAVEPTGFALAPDGVRLAWWSTGQGEPLLLLNGQGADHHMWDRVVPLLAPHHRVIGFDTRGTGRSDAPTSQPYSTKAFACDAVAVLDAADVERAHVYGFSMGGRTAQWVAIEHGHRVGSLVLGATSPGDAHGAAREPEVDAIFTAPPSLATRRAMARLMYHPRFVAEHLAKGDLYQPPPLPPAVQALHFEASKQHDAWDELGRITAPTLLLHGTDDQLNPTGNSRLMAERIAGSELVLLERARHGYHDECLEKAARVVLDFLARHPLR